MFLRLMSVCWGWHSVGHPSLRYGSRLSESGRGAGTECRPTIDVRAGGALRLLDYLYEQPIINVRAVERHLGLSFVTANKLIELLIKLELLKETTGGQRNRRYAYSPYLALFESSATKAEEQNLKLKQPVTSQSRQRQRCLDRYLNGIYQKFAVRSGTEAVARARQQLLRASRDDAVI